METSNEVRKRIEELEAQGEDGSYIEYLYRLETHMIMVENNRRDAELAAQGE